MKCEICHENPAETAIGTDGDGEELYVCKACAEKEQKRRRKRRERTRKAQESAVEGGGGGEAPPFIDAFLSAVTNMVDDIHKAVQQQQHEEAPPDKPRRNFKPLRGMKVDTAFMMHGRLHLEALHLIGEMEAVHRAVNALGLRLDGLAVDGISDVGHIYSICHDNDAELARRAVDAIVEQERNARIRLFESMTRVFDDALCRALAILKNCRLLSEGEYFDLLSPLRLAAQEDMLDGIKLKEIERMMKSMKLEQDGGYPATVEEREEADAIRADEANQRFEDVVLDD